MENHNIKLILKSELQYKMTSHMCKEIIEESKISNQTLGRKESIELLFKERSIKQIVNLILNKYKNKGDCENYNRLFNRINGLSIDERRELDLKKEKSKRGKAVISPSTDYGYDFYNRPEPYELDDGYYNIFFEDND